MSCVVELAELCAASYGDNATATFPLTGGNQVTWTQADHWQRLNFYAALYAKAGGGGRVLAFRGTDDAIDGISDDADIALGGMPPTALAALSLPITDQSNLILTGHSLGGALAIIAAARWNLPAVTFNAPGVMDSCLATTPTQAGSGLTQLLAMVARCVSNSRIRNIRINADPVSSFFTTGLQPGRTETYSAPTCGMNVLCRHGIATCVSAVRGDSGNFQEVSL